MALTIQEQMLVEQRVTNEAKSAGTAYLLWFFLGLFSAHRFYLGRPGSAFLQILSYFVIIGFVWWIVDAFLIGDMIKEDNANIRRRLSAQFEGPDDAPPGPPVDMSKWSHRDRVAHEAANARREFQR